MLYLSLKVLHIFGFVAWFAGIFYIWRLFVYHAETESEDVRAQRVLMAGRLYGFIMRVAMVATLTGGFGMLYLNWAALTRFYWIWVKLGLIGLVLINHFLSGYYLRKLQAGERFQSSRNFRILNELPTLLLLAIVILAVFRPF